MACTDIVDYRWDTYGFESNDSSLVYRRLKERLVDPDNNPIAGFDLMSQPQSDALYVTNIWVHRMYRGEGYGSQLMRHLVDTYGRSCMELVASPYDGSRMTVPKLVAFYQRYGFVAEAGCAVQFVGVPMVRPPTIHQEEQPWPTTTP